MKDPTSIKPPRLAEKLFEWYCENASIEDLHGDMEELFYANLERMSVRNARFKYWRQVVSLMFSYAIVKRRRKSASYFHSSNHTAMIKSYFKIGIRNLLKNKGYALINIGGLAIGMSVAILIGLWIWDELSFNKGFKNYDRIGQVWQFVTFDVEKSSFNSLPIPLSEELRDNYPEFESVTLSGGREVILSTDSKKFVKTGNYVQPAFIEMMSLKILSGSTEPLKDINAVMLSESLAKNFFGSEDPVNKTVIVNNNQTLKITAVYQDFPINSTFKDVTFLAAWDFLLANDTDVRESKDNWRSNSYAIFVQLKEGADFRMVSEKIKDILMEKENPPDYKPEFFLHPMSKWHLYGEFKNGKNVGGLIEYVLLFGLIGIFVLVLACINFMNLSTARSEKRAKEVGIRKSIGSARSQLVFQFLTESFVIVFVGFLMSLLLVQLALPFFNDVAGKKVSIAWMNPWFWSFGIVFSWVTGFVAGCYPALYLSSFVPVKVLKGTFRASRSAALPRKFLVVFQFTVSITLVIGIIVIFGQIDFAKNRAVGYDRSKLIEVGVAASQGRFETLRNDLLKCGAVSEVSKSTGSVTTQYGGTTGVSWQGKTSDMHPLLMSNRITHEYGKTIGWHVLEGRDFSREFSTDSSAVILNESAVQLMAFKKPLDETVNYNGRDFHVIGVIGDMIKESPFDPVKPTFYILDYESANIINIKLAAQIGVTAAVRQVEEVFKRDSPASPFDYKFVDEEFARKFSNEERIGKLSTFFATLAIIISSLGVFGLASFTAEQRTKEIGVRKILGASVFNLWGMLSRDFIALVIISSFLAMPIAYYYMNEWLARFQYRTTIAWWVFVAPGLGVLIITLTTISYQSIKTAVINPVDSLRSE